MITKIILFANFLIPQSNAQSLQVNLSKGLGAPILNIYEVKPAEVSKLTAVAKLKYFEVQKKWKECTGIAPSAFAEAKDLRGWILISWLNCSGKFAEGQKKPEKIIYKPVSMLQKNIALLDRGPWQTSLSALWVKSLQALIDSKSRYTKSALEWAFLRPEYLSSDFKNNYFVKLQAQSWPSSLAVKKVYTLTAADAEAEEQQNLEGLWSQKTKETPKDSMAEPIVKYLLNYPSGKYQKIWRDRLVDSYNSLWDQKNADAANVLKSIMKLDQTRLGDIAKNFHRRANFLDALSVAELAMKKGNTTTSMYWVAARSALFTGQSEKAKSYFTILIQEHSGTEEAVEALFRLGLLHYRLGNPQQAQGYFEKLLALGKDRGELNTRYWYVRSLQASHSSQFETERDQLVEDYPFSYYGLKLHAEKTGGVIAFDSKNANAEIPQKITLAGEDVQTWKRAQILIKSGWWIEANQEVNGLPWSQNASLQLAWAQWLAAQKLWPSAIRLINQAFESNPQLRNWNLMKNFFPQDYIQVIKVESDKRKINPVLIQSLIRQESAFGLKAISTSNALGLMQMIPPTAQEIARQMKLSLHWPDDMYSPQINIPMGVFYISQMLEECKGHVPLALASYNAGPSRMKLWLASRPETQNLISTFSTDVRDEIWIDELPWNETSFYVKAILRNILLYQLSEEKSLTLKPAFWADLVIKNVKTL